MDSDSQKGIRVELLESKSQMDGTIVELINGIEVIKNHLEFPPFGRNLLLKQWILTVRQKFYVILLMAL